MNHNLFEVSEGERKRWEDERHELLVREVSDLLENVIVDEYQDRQDELWNREYSSIDRYLESVEPNRQR
jgi:hypothetical protein